MPLNVLVAHATPFTIIYVAKAGGLNSVLRVIRMYMDQCHDCEPQGITGWKKLDAMDGWLGFGMMNIKKNANGTCNLD